MIQLVDKVNMRFISQLIRDISRVFQKLLKYFNDTAISTSMVLPMRRFLPVIFASNLNDSGSVMLLFWSSFGTAIKVQIYLHNCHCILLDCTSTSQHIDLLHDLLAIIYIAYAVSEWCTISDVISFVFSSCRCNCSSTSNPYNSLNKYVCITLVIKAWLRYCSTKTWFEYFCFIFDAFHHPFQQKLFVLN